MKKFFTLLTLLIGVSSFGHTAKARENVDFWYVKDLKSQITVNIDSSIDVTEDITADCGIAQKHGIFRTLPTFQQITDSEKIQSPISLTSITNFAGDPIKFSTTKSSSDGTITWKIGDPDRTVSGLNYYRIKYQVKNAVRHNSANFDEFYWNLSGNFWDMEIDNFSASITFPGAVNKTNSELNTYSGNFASKNSLDVSANWKNDHQVEVNYPKTLKTGEGITLSTTFPKNIVMPYIPGFWEKYGSYFFLLLPIISLFLMYFVWNKLGRDPKINPTIAPEFEIPEKLSPIEMGLVITDGILKNNFISASIINLAIAGALKIEKIGPKGAPFGGKKDFKLTKNAGDFKLSDAEEKLITGLFFSEDQVQISDLKNKFYTNIPKILDAGNNYLISKNWLIKNSRLWQYVFITIGFFIFVASIAAFGINYLLGISALLSAFVVIIFSLIMPRRPKEGALLLRRVKGFKLYMHTAERYRQKFNEKENIFEKFLPYAIMFGITKEWTAKMHEIYGEKYFTTYRPVWFIGPNFSEFNVDSIVSEISSMSSNMASTISSSPSSSGSGGGGFSGGGGGGGGGGGW